MKLLPVILLCALLASCASTVPRAIIPPKAEIAKLDVAPVAAAGKASREAVRDVAKAGEQTRRASDSLRDQIDRTAEAAAPYLDLTEPFAELRRRADLLAAKLAFAESKEKIALETIDAMDSEIGHLSARVASQSAQIDYADASQNTLREQLVALAGSDAKRIIAEDKLRWWKSAALWTWAILLALFLIGAFLRRAGRFPF